MSSVKVSGTWEDVEAPYVKVGGGWNIAKSAWTKLSGEWKSWFLQGGVLDVPLGGEDDPTYANSFNFNLEALPSDPLSIANQPDGKILIGGRDFFLRLNSNGTQDTAFNTALGTGPNNEVVSIAIQSDGKIILGGSLASFNGTTVSRIARLNSDGTLDTSFTTNAGTGPDRDVTSIAIQSDGKIVVGGDFSTFNGTTVGASGAVTRLNSDGSLDTAFVSNAGSGVNADVEALAIQPDGKILVGGDFSTFNGTTVGVSGAIIRLNSNGSLDTAFNTNGGTGVNNDVTAIAIQSDGKILVGGQFSAFNGTTTGSTFRLNSDGSLDTAFTTNGGTGTNDDVFAIAIQSDGKILIGGVFSSFNGTAYENVARLNSDGTLDTSFVSSPVGGSKSIRIVVNSDDSFFYAIDDNFIYLKFNSDGTPEPVPGFSQPVETLAVQPDGKILAGGLFRQFRGTTVNGIVRLSSDGTLDTAFTTNTGTGADITISSVAIQPDGKILVGGVFLAFNGTTVGRIVRLNSNGTIDTAFLSNTGTGASSTVSSIAIQSDGKILVGGSFTSFNGTTINRIARLNSDGTLDTAFATNIGTGTNGTVFAIAIQSDGKILLSGAFSTFNGTVVNRIARLSSNGTLDTAFFSNTGTGAAATVSSIAIQSDGKIVIGGYFSTFNGTVVNRIARLSSNGTLDTAFLSNTGTGPNSGIVSIAVQTDGKIILGGVFATFNGTTVSPIARLNSDGTLDTDFTTNSGIGAGNFVNSIATQSDGKILVAGDFSTFNGNARNKLARIGGGIAQ